MEVIIPRKFGSEINYVIDVLLQDILGIENYAVSYSEVESQTTIIVESGSINIENHFFIDGNCYVQDNLPKKAELCQFLNIEIVSLYGENKISKSGNVYQIQSDIIASSFLLLSQWEYELTGNKDQYDRLKLSDSVIGKFDLYQRPVINEYAALLKEIFKELGITVDNGTYKVIFSCDVDSITKYSSIRNLLGAIYHSRYNIKNIADSISAYFESKKNKLNDPYYSFDYLMKRVKSKGLAAVFYFMAGKGHEKDVVDYQLDEEAIRQLFDKMQNENFEMGIHPSFLSSSKRDLITDEIKSLSIACNKKIIHSRQHYLRYNVNHTWNDLENHGIVYDSSVQFTEGLGFGAGICHPYHLYDLVNNKKLNIIEIPLLVMIKKDYAKSYDSRLDKIESLVKTAKKYNGHYMILFHNSNVETVQERIFFERVLDMV